MDEQTTTNESGLIFPTKFLVIDIGAGIAYVASTKEEAQKYIDRKNGNYIIEEL